MPPVDKGEALKPILLGIAITALLFGAAVSVPVLGAVAILLIPLPVLISRLKLGQSRGAVVVVAAFFLWLAQSGEMTADLFIFLEQLILGFAMGELMERDYPLEKVVGYAAGIVFLVGGGMVFVYANAAGDGTEALLSTYIDANLAIYKDVYREIGNPQETSQAVSDMLREVRYVLIRLMPGLGGAAALFAAWISLLLAKPALKMVKLPVFVGEGLTLWKAPEKLVWGVIGCGGVMIIPDGGIRLICLNGLIILMQVYFFQGIAIVSFYFEKKHTPRVLRGVLYSLVLFQMYLLVFVIGLGFFDMWLDFRKMKQPTETNGVS